MDLVFDPRHAQSCAGAEEAARCVRDNEELIDRALRGPFGGNALLGWFSPADSAPGPHLDRIREESRRVHADADTMLVLGIGGSNRGAMAATAALHRSLRSPTRVVFAGDTLSASSMRDALDVVSSGSVVLNVIAKDFNTVEPGVTFRVLREAMVRRYGAEYAGRIVVTGSHGPGQLCELADRHGYHFLEFPASIGGRFSVLSAVGLFPMAVAGIDVAEVLAGAADAESALKKADVRANPAVLYAAWRKLLFSKGFTNESLVIFEPDLVPLARWWVQLFAETEGKTPNAVLPTFFSYSEDLHAVGQYVQQGRRCITETFLRLFHEDSGLFIPASPQVRDGFGYLDGRPFDELNRVVYAAAQEAHSRDGVPCLEISCPPISTRTLGELFYFFMFACYVSATLLGVEPFTQHGVEGYKRSMHRMLGKNG